MNLQANNIISITQARGRLGDLADEAVASNYFVLTRGGSPKVALVDFEYLRKLEGMIEKIYQKTYIDPKLEQFARDFSDKEIQEWQSEDEG